MILLHLVPEAEWAARPAAATTYAPASLATEGFVHCTEGDELVLQVADAFYRDVDLVVLSIDTDRLASEVRWEAPSPAAPAASDVTAFPHVYGPIEVDAVTEVRRVVRGPNGNAEALVAYDANA